METTTITVATQWIYDMDGRWFLSTPHGTAYVTAANAGDLGDEGGYWNHEGPYAPGFHTIDADDDVAIVGKQWNGEPCDTWQGACTIARTALLVSLRHAAAELAAITEDDDATEAT